MRVLIISKIFPNRHEPLSSPFNRQQFAALAERADVQVLATIPYFPGIGFAQRFSAAGRLTTLPHRDVIGGMAVAHPRFFYLPRIGHAVADRLYAASLWSEVASRRAQTDVILGSWAYPDGCAAVRLGERLGIPAVVKVHGSDINLLARRKGPRAAMQRWLPRAARVVAVSRALKRELEELGVDSDRIDVVRNGIDPELFRPKSRALARQKLGWTGADKMLLYVGRLEPEKGVDDLVDAFDRVARRRDDTALVLVGDGRSRPACEGLARRFPGRVAVLGGRPLSEVSDWLAACDVMTLPSHNEGTPNVVLEALASGRRVVATSVGGIPDLLHDRNLGALVPARDRGALADALHDALSTPYEPEAVAARAGVVDWPRSAEQLRSSLECALDRVHAPQPQDSSRAWAIHAARCAL